MPSDFMEERDDLSDVWGTENEAAFQEALQHNTRVIDSLVTTDTTRRSRSGVSTGHVPLERHYANLYRDYVKEKIAQQEENQESEEAESIEEERQVSIRLPSDEEESSLENHVERGAYTTNQLRECFMCACGDEYHDGIEAPYMNKLHTIIKVNYHRYSNYDIAVQIHLYYMKEIYPTHKRLPILTVETALEHIEGLHSLDATIYLGESIRDEKRISFLLKNRIFNEDGTYDRNTLKDYHKSKDKLLNYYKTRLDNLNFTNGNIEEDLRRGSQYTNIMPSFTRRQETRKRQTLAEKTRHFNLCKV